MTGRGAPGKVTRLLREWRRGDPEAREELWSIVYGRLKELAHHILEDRPRRRPLRTTDLVHEAYLKLVGGEEITVNDRRHFFSIAARAMRYILVDHARRAHAAKCGGGEEPLPLEEALGLPVAVDVDLLALDEALNQLRDLDARQHQIVELAYFGGLSYAEIGEAVGVSLATVSRELKTAKMWLLRQLRREGRSVPAEGTPGTSP